jgi:uncharacterized SAM-binding protein YcdF (DUF218 family)
MTVLKHIVEFAFSPLGFLTLLLLGGFVLSFRKEHWLSARRGLRAVAILYFVFLCTPLGEVLIASLEQQYAPLLNPESVRGVRHIVVLAAYGERISSTPITSNLSEETVYRLVEGVRIYRRVSESNLIVCGGVVRRGDPPIANLMADFLVAMGIPTRDILIEGDSRDTYENLRNASRFVEKNPFFLVTSAAHLRRAMRVAEKLKLKPIACPAQIATLQAHPPGRSWARWTRDTALSVSLPSIGRLYLIQFWFHEYAGYWWYRVLGRI